MDFILENWYIIVGAIIILIVFGVGIYAFFKLPRKAQIAKVKEWLLFVVAEAEKELGGGTGQLKLRFVYDQFIQKFPSLAMWISFEYFSKLVDEALEVFRGMIDTNDAVKSYIEEGK